ncbi:type IV fimbrial biogenesis protein FimT [Pseudoxanthomonas sp. GM95]|uniref:GspH/FimT family pseudopilin n=1 Tax=Pseudoxanthomonas sp. GM95 TaxID=1881043 RepID=UPI0008BD0D11|nr:GspH/FimT family pseudopilin [Pseudoxanthomonas sp. GM95]SEK68671.1 type IV fimbrial biogenesis protein FimT [Pseudoxanthomonas sp. GM95]
MDRRSTTQGFTLLELMVAIAIAAILLSLALPSFQSTMRSNRLATTSNQFIAAIALARSDAIKTTRATGICGSTDGAACAADGTWTGGFLVWQDTNRDGAKNTGEAVLNYSPLTAANMTAAVTGSAGTPARLLFDARGRLQPYGSSGGNFGGTATLTLTSRPCPSGQQLVRSLLVNSTGQLTKINGACP